MGGRYQSAAVREQQPERLPRDRLVAHDVPLETKRTAVVDLLGTLMVEDARFFSWVYPYFATGDTSVGFTPSGYPKIERA